MQKLRALILDETVDEVLRAVQSKGNVHIVDINRTLPQWENLAQSYMTEQETRRWRSVLNRINRVLSNLGLKKELGLIEQLFKPRGRALIEVDAAEEMELLSTAEDKVSSVEREVEENIEKFQIVRELLWELRNAKTDIEELRSTERLYIKFGKLANEKIQLLENELRSRVRYVSMYTEGKKRTRFVALVSLCRFSEEIEKIISNYRFQEISFPKEISGTPNSCLRFLESQSSNILKKYERQMLCLHDAVLAKIERLKIKERLGKTKRIFVLEAWIPEEEKQDIKSVIDEASEGYATMVVSPPDEPQSEIPTLLKDRNVIGSFRMLTEMYGVPLYNEIDPTPFLAIFFTFFVGLMSADLAIGTTIIVSGLLIRRGAGSRSENMKNLSVVLLCIGISTVFFGVLMGEFMGGLVELPVLWMSAAEDPISFLLIVIGIGMGHLVFGSILGFLNNLSKRQFRRIVGEQLSTLLLIGSAAIFLVTGRFEFQGTSVVGYVAGIIGLAALMIGKGPIGLLELTRLLSSVISYVRILALNMATAWMGRTFVLLGTLVVGTYLVGPVLNGTILLFSHFFIVFISVFATFAHSLRLHYVEFFGRFFIGGGTRFSPLTSEREYTVSKSLSQRIKVEE